MADLLTDQVTVAIILFAVALGVVSFLELRYLRKRMKGRRVRSAKRDEDIEDEAHNAVVTTKAILSAMERQGIRSDEAAAWLREAQMASSRRNYRVAIDLTTKAKDRLLALKASEAAKGDLAKLDQLVPSAGSNEITTKELLQKEYPPNLLQSRFSIELAGTAVAAASAAGRDVTQATQFLDAAKARFEANDYSSALALARQSKRASDGESVEMTVPPSTSNPVVPASRGCPTCGAPLQADDVFCRKCGTRLVARVCASCRADLLEDDAFCRKCGASVRR